MECRQGTHPSANAGLVVRRECDSSMFRAFCRHTEEILIMGAQHPAHMCSPLEMVGVFIAE